MREKICDKILDNRALLYIADLRRACKRSTASSCMSGSTWL